MVALLCAGLLVPAAGASAAIATSDLRLLVRDDADSTVSALAGATVDGTIRFVVRPDSKVQRVVFKLDGRTLATDRSAPFYVRVDTTTVTDGSHTGVAVVTATDGRKHTLRATFTVANGSEEGSAVPAPTPNPEPTPAPLVVAQRVNAGGAQLTATPAWTADSEAAPSRYITSTSNQFASTTTPIKLHSSVPAGTPTSLFTTERFDSTGTGMTYTFPVTAGTYQLRLYFAEIYSGAQKTGARTLDVLVNNTLVLDDYDTFADVGGYTGVMKSFPVTADNTITITFRSTGADNPRVMGLEVVTAPTPELTPTPEPTPNAPPTVQDALQRRVLAELQIFTEWLRKEGVKGFVGEVGWPNDVDAAEWDAAAALWYADAAAANLLVTAWATGDWWGDAYKLSSYGASNWQWTGVDTPRSQAAVIERQAAVQRGINVAGAEFAFPADASSSTYSNVNPGVYGTHWTYPSEATLRYLASRGITTVRLPIRWERVQPQLGGALDTAELRRLTDTLAQARDAGLGVIVDVHNYAGYYLHDGTKGVRRSIGSAEVTNARFTDLWLRLSRALRSHNAVAGYGLMNEPVGMIGGAPAWETASQAAVDAIRGDGDTTLILVPGYEWSGAQRWSSVHPKAWITDPAGNHRYEAHHYFDRDNSSRYLRSYRDEVINAASRGY